MRFRVLCVMLVVLLLTSEYCMASSLPTLSCWYSDSSFILRWKKSYSLMVESYLISGGTVSDYDGSVGHGASQWTCMFSTFNFYRSEPAAQIFVAGATLSDLTSMGIGYPSNAGGITNQGYHTYEGSLSYSGTTKYLYSFNTVVVYLRSDMTYDTRRAVAAHEFGHAIGYGGHSSFTDGALYASSTSLYPRTEEKNHMLQVKY